MISYTGLSAALAVYLLVLLSSSIVVSFSTIRRNQLNGFKTENGSFGIDRQRSCRDEAKSLQNMVVDSNFAESTIENDDAKERNLSGETLNLQTSVWEHLSDWFQGDFDNYAQVVEDRKQNLQPREGGGHEHFHCTLVPVTESTRLAAFFFDGNPDRIFRFRYYEMMPSSDEDGSIEMMLNTLHPDLEIALKSEASNPLSWPSIFESFQPSKESEPKVNRLMKCEICWSYQRDNIQHSYLKDTPENKEEDSSKSIHAIMIHGPTIVNSTIIPGMQIRIVDQLSLYQNIFYINDRGFDPITGSFIYGNQREVPYRLERVSSISSNTTSAMTEQSASKLQRIVTNPDLEWTLGPEFRSTEEYNRKLESIGGPSVGMNRKSYKSSGRNID